MVVCPILCLGDMRIMDYQNILKYGVLAVTTLLFAQLASTAFAQSPVLQENPSVLQKPISQKPTSQNKGLSFVRSLEATDKVVGIVKLHCTGANESTGADKTYKCNPYQGDMLCSVELPVLCFKDIGALAPSSLKDPQYWSGGIVVTTPKVAGDKFKNIASVNAYCAAEFGRGWRAASFHDGGGWGIQAYGNVGDATQRVWVDIKDQKDGTCWSR